MHTPPPVGHSEPSQRLALDLDLGNFPTLDFLASLPSPLTHCVFAATKPANSNSSIAFATFWSLRLNNLVPSGPNQFISFISLSPFSSVVDLSSQNQVRPTLFIARANQQHQPSRH